MGKDLGEKRHLTGCLNSRRLPPSARFILWLRNAPTKLINRKDCITVGTRNFVVVVQSLSHVWLFVTTWTAACQASLSFTISQSLLKLMYIGSVMPSNYFILYCPLLLLPSIFPSFRVFSNESALQSGAQSIGILTSTSVLPMNIQGWFPLGLTGLISFAVQTLIIIFLHSISLKDHLGKLVLRIKNRGYD